jgi:hypothetical protein
VRSFDLGGRGAGGRRWSARCHCGALATTGAWPDALAFVTDHLRVTARPRAVWTANHATPDLRRVEYGIPVVVKQHVNGHRPGGAGVRRRTVGLLRSAVRVLLSLAVVRNG